MGQVYFITELVQCQPENATKNIFLKSVAILRRILYNKVEECSRKERNYGKQKRNTEQNETEKA